MNGSGLYERSLGSLLATLVARTPGAAHAVLSSVDGIALATSTGLPTSRAEQLAGVGAGLLSLAEGTDQFMSTGTASQVLVEMAAGLLLTAPVSGGVCLTLLASEECERERLGFEIAQFAERVAPLLQPAH